MRLNGAVLLAGCVLGGSLATLVQGALDGPLLLLVLGISLTVAVLVFLGAIAESRQANVAGELRAGGPRAYAPAVVNSVRAEHKESGKPLPDGRDRHSVFVFDLTVAPEGRQPYRVRIAHPLDLQGLLGRSWAVVEYDPRQPWRAMLPARPPREWEARAARLVLMEKVTARPVGPRLPAGAEVLFVGVPLAVLFFLLGRALV